jgi:hypothetical protein
MSEEYEDVIADEVLFAGVVGDLGPHVLRGPYLVEFEGQGHGIKGLENNVRNYRVWFEFLEGLGSDTAGP